jgi:Mn-containing catalase
MFIFEKRTQMPVKIHNKNPKLAGFILSQYGGALTVSYISSISATYTQ